MIDVVHQLGAEVGLIVVRSVEGVDQDDIDGRVDGRGRDVCKDSGRHRRKRREFDGVTGGECDVLVKGIDCLGFAALEDGEILFFQVVNGVSVLVGDRDIDDD